MLGKPSKKLKKELEANGKRANATIVEIAEKGMAITRGADNVVANTEIALKTHLRVQPDDEPEFEVKKRFSYPQMAVPRAGQTVPVLYDPADHDKIIVDYSGEAQQNAAFASAGHRPEPDRPARAAGRADAAAAEGQMPGMGQVPGMTPPAPAQPQVDPVTQLEKLAKLKESGALTEAEFEAEKAKIIGSVAATRPLHIGAEGEARSDLCGAAARGRGYVAKPSLTSRRSAAAGARSPTRSGPVLCSADTAGRPAPPAAGTRSDTRAGTRLW